jgi:hypothetical protein
MMSICESPRLLRPLRSLLAPALVVLLTLLSVQGAAAQEPCGPPNVVPGNSCNMENWSGDPPRALPEGWQPFVLSGDVEYARDDHSYFGGGTLRMRNSGGAFKAGILTTVAVTPGAGYRGSVWWGAPNAPELFGRQLGLDPTGGTDPGAPTVIWGPTHFGDGRFLNYKPGEGPNIDVLARALGDRMTIFFLVDHPSSSGDNFIYIDVITLVPDEAAPQVTPPTATPEPPTATPTLDVSQMTPTFVPVVVQAAAAAPIATEAPTATPAPTEPPTATPSATPSATPTDTPTPTLTPTPSPTWTPWPTAEPLSLLDLGSGALGGGAAVRSLALPLAAGGPTDVASGGSVRVGLVALSALSLLGALLFGASLLRMRRRTR